MSIQPISLDVRHFALLTVGDTIYQADTKHGVVFTCTLSDNDTLTRRYKTSFIPVEPLLRSDVVYQLEFDPTHDLHFFSNPSDAEAYIEYEASLTAPEGLVRGDFVLITGCRTIPADYLGTIGVVQEVTGTHAMVQLKAAVGLRGSIAHGADTSDLHKVGHTPKLLERVAQTGFAPKAGDV